MDYARVVIEVILIIYTINVVIKKKELNRLLNEKKSKLENFKNKIEVLNKKIKKSSNLVKILFIDDEDYGFIADIRERKSNNIFFFDQTIKVKYVDQCEPFNIIFIDYKGVTTGGTFTHDGLSYACAVKEKYPDKIVVLYSSGSLKGTNSQETCSVSTLDGFLNKHGDIDIWVKEISNRIEVLRSFDHQNKSFDKLTSKYHGINHSKLNNAFSNFLKTKDFNEFIVQTVDLVEDIEILEEILEIAFNASTIVGEVE